MGIGVSRKTAFEISLNFKGEALSLGVSWDFPFESGFSKKLQTPPRRQQSIIREGDVDHHPDFYNHTPLVMSPSRLNKSCP